MPGGHDSFSLAQNRSDNFLKQKLNRSVGNTRPHFCFTIKKNRGFAQNLPPNGTSSMGGNVPKCTASDTVHETRSTCQSTIRMAQTSTRRKNARSGELVQQVQTRSHKQTTEWSMAWQNTTIRWSKQSAKTQSMGRNYRLKAPREYRQSFICRQYNMKCTHVSI